MNVQALAGLNNLAIVNLYGNSCMSKDFRLWEDATVIADLNQQVREKCTYCEINAGDFIEMHLTAERKMREIEELLNDAQKMKAEINDKNEKIKKLEEKIQIMSQSF